MKGLFKFILLIYCALRSLDCIGQQQIGVNFKTNFGKTVLSFDANPNQMEDISPAINTFALFAGIHYKIGKYIGLDLNVFDQKYNWKFTDNQTISLNNGDYIKMNAQSASHLQGYSGNLNFYFPIKGSDKAAWTFTSGYSWGKTKPIIGSTDFAYSEHELSINQDNGVKEISSAFLETGILFKIGKRTQWSAHLGYNHAFDNIFNCSYHLQTNNNQSTTHIESNTGTFYFGSSLSYSVFTIKKRVKKKKYQPEYNEKEEVVAINNRKVYPSHRIDVNSGTVEIEVWDYGREDGDKISLFLNDKKVLNKYKLTRKKKKINLKLKPGMNKLIVYAHNLGKDPPNTASVIVFEGDEKHSLSLESTLGQCGAIEIVW